MEQPEIIAQAAGNAKQSSRALDGEPGDYSDWYTAGEFIGRVRELIAEDRSGAWPLLERTRDHTLAAIDKWTHKPALHLHMLEGNYSAATSLGETLLRRADFTERDRAYTSKHLFYGYLFGANNPIRAGELLAELEAMDDRAAVRGLLAADFERLSGFAPHSVPLASEFRQETEELAVSSYPNPFNIFRTAWQKQQPLFSALNHGSECFISISQFLTKKIKLYLHSIIKE